MSFFKKMKERLFKSSSKLDEGLNALVEDGEEVEEQAVEAAASDVPAEPADAAAEAPASPKPPVPAPQSPAPETPAPQVSPAPQAGILSRALGAITGPRPVRRRVLDDDMLEGLGELLIPSDMGVDTSLKVSAALAEGRFGRAVGADEIKQALAEEVAKILEPVARPLPLYAKRPQVVLVCGVNGSGKTTTTGKLASQLKGAGKSDGIAAGVTARAPAD